MRTRIKVCGFTRGKDLAEAQKQGIDAAGFVLFKKSKRAVDFAKLEELSRFLTPFVTPVLLFVNPEREEVLRALEIMPRALLQFHGAESPEFCRSFGRPWIKAIPVRENENLAGKIKEFDGAEGILLDTPTSEWGGSGRSFDWSLADSVLKDRLILAGGLNPENVGLAVKALRPYAVDVSSGVEEGPGIKDAAKIAAFVSAVAKADNE